MERGAQIDPAARIGGEQRPQATQAGSCGVEMLDHATALAVRIAEPQDLREHSRASQRVGEIVQAGAHGARQHRPPAVVPHRGRTRHVELAVVQPHAELHQAAWWLHQGQPLVEPELVGRGRFEQRATGPIDAVGCAVLLEQDQRSAERHVEIDSRPQPQPLDSTGGVEDRPGDDRTHRRIDDRRPVRRLIRMRREGACRERLPGPQGGRREARLERATEPVLSAQRGCLVAFDEDVPAVAERCHAAVRVDFDRDRRSVGSRDRVRRETRCSGNHLRSFYPVWVATRRSGRILGCMQHAQLEELERTHQDLTRQMADPEIVSDPARYRAAHQALVEIDSVVQALS